MKKAMLVINPRSGKGKAPMIENAAIGIAQEHGYELTVRLVTCLLYTSDAADERSSVDLGGRRIIKKKRKKQKKKKRQ